MAKLSLSLLGQFQVVLECDSDTQVVVSFRTRKEAALLAYLAAEVGHWQPRAQLGRCCGRKVPQGRPGTVYARLSSGSAARSKPPARPPLNF